MSEDHAAVVDKYEITETILKSPEGVIYRAVDTSNGAKVLLKKYYPLLDWSEEVLNDFFNLFSYLRFIEHECLLTILDVGKENGRPYVVFSDDSVTLLSERKELPSSQKDVLDFLTRVAEVLDFLHKQEITHGGLSTENIAMDPYGYPLLFDFGLNGVFKKLLLENMDEGFENLSVGDLRCTSPEQILGRSASRISDIYSYGVVSFYFLFGELPFEGQYAPETAIAHFRSDILGTLQLPKAIPDDVLHLIEKCIQVNAEARFTGFNEVVASLEQIRAGKRVRLQYQKRFAIQKIPVRIKFSPVWAGVGGAVLLVVLAVAYFYNRNAQLALSTSQAGTQTAAAVAAITEPPVLETETVVPVTATEAGDTPTASATVPVGPTEYRLAFEDMQPVTAIEAITNTNLANLREISRLGYGKPEEADASPDDQYLAVATSAGVVILEGDQFFSWLDPGGWATSVQFSPDGQTLAVGLMSGEIQLWDWRAGTKAEPLTGHSGRINRILYTPSGRLYSAAADRRVIVWNVSSHSKLLEIAAHSQPVNDIAITRDERTLITCADDKLIRVWDLASGAKLYELDRTYFSGNIKAVALTSDDAYFAAGGDAGFLYQWNLVTSPSPPEPLPQRRTDIVPVKQRIWTLEYIRDDKELLVGVDDGEGILYDAARQGYEGISLEFGLAARALDLIDVYGSQFDFDAFSVFYQDSTVSMNWNGEISNPSGQLVSPYYDILDHLDFSPDGTVLAAGGRRGSTQVWNLSTNEVFLQTLYFLPLGDPIAPDGSSVALIVPKTIRTQQGNTLQEDNYQIKNLTGGQATRDLTQALPGANVAYTSDGNLFVAANLRQSKAWDASTGNETNVQGYPYTGCWVTASVSDVNDRLQVYSATGVLPALEGPAIDTLCPRTYQFRAAIAAISSDMTLMAYVNANGLLEAFDVATQLSPWPPYRLDGPMSALAVSPDGSVIAVGMESGRLLFIDGVTGQLLSEVTGNFGRLNAIEFSDDGKKIATAGQDGLVRVFGIVEFE